MAERPVLKRDDLPPEVYDQLVQRALDQFRTVPAQAAWYIKLGLEQQGALETKGLPDERTTAARPPER
jgi:hypothetical protein